MRGKCPVCRQWIESKVPKPLVFSDDAVVIPDEEWPEPAELIHSPRNEDAGEYVLKSPDQKATDKPIQYEEELIGTYSLAFEPDLPQTTGVTRGAEWDQASVPSAPVPSPAPVHEPSITRLEDNSKPTETYQTVIDPLFGDEVQVPIVPAKESTSATAVSVPQAPVAKPADPLADTAQAVVSEEARLQAPVTVPASEELQLTKRKKKRKVKSEEQEEEDFSHLNSPTSETHLYRLSDAEENRIKPDAPPSLLFFDGVFTFPWEGKNLFPWIWLTLGFVFIYLLLALTVHIGNSDSMVAKVGAGAVMMASLLVYVFVLSYGCMCWVNTINYTAAGSHSVEWHSEGWKENVVHFLRIGYYLFLAMLMASPLLVLNFFEYGWLLWMAGVLLLFPLFLFSGFASLTFWNFLHEQVIRQIVAKLPHYLTMYFLGLGLFAFISISEYFAQQYYMLAFIAGPITAAAWLIYGRLLGRMAYVLQQSPKRKKKKKKKPENTESSSSEVKSPMQASETV
ncbi:MAG TPA: hypothetical protein PKA06_05835 [Gemmatales bacterium]|nr:hypothetical protein [Gemmatales bacterium]